VDAILNIYKCRRRHGCVSKGYRKHVLEELPFMATENIMMEAVKKGGDRQELHERIRFIQWKLQNRLRLKERKMTLLKE